MADSASTTKPYLIFVSHSTKDRWIARHMARLLEEKGRRSGVKAFLDAKDIDSGDLIPDAVRRNLQSCNELMVLLTRNSIDRPWVLIEMGAAWGLEKRIVAIIDKIAPDEMPDIIAPHKAMDINDFDEYLAQVIKRARGNVQ